MNHVRVPKGVATTEAAVGQDDDALALSGGHAQLRGKPRKLRGTDATARPEEHTLRQAGRGGGRREAAGGVGGVEDEDAPPWRREEGVVRALGVRARGGAQRRPDAVGAEASGIARARRDMPHSAGQLAASIRERHERRPLRAAIGILGG